MGLIVKRRVTLDLSRRGHQVTVPFSVGDRVAHEVIFTLRDGSELIELPPGVTAAIAVKNGYNGTGCVDACVIDHINNTITYTPTVEALSIEGNIECTLHVFDADGAVIGAPTFIFAVSEGDNANTEREVGDALEASSGWDIIAETVSKAEAAAKSAKDAEDYANRAKTALGNATLKASEAEVSAAEALAHQRAANINATNAAKSAGDAETSAGAAAKSAGAAATSAEKAAMSELSARQSMDEAEDAAGKAKESEESCEDMALGMQGLYELAVEFSEEAKAAADSANRSYLFAQQEADRATEYGTSLLVQGTGNDDRKVMSQDASTKAFVTKVEKSTGDWVYVIKSGVPGVMQLQYGSPTSYSLAARLDGGELRVGTPKADTDATPKKYVEDNFPRFRHTIHSDTSTGNQGFVAFTLNIYSTFSIAFTNETFISALGEKVNDRTPLISVSGCIVENGTKTQIMGLFFDNDSELVVMDDYSREIRTGLSTLLLYDDVVQV